MGQFQLVPIMLLKKSLLILALLYYKSRAHCRKLPYPAAMGGDLPSSSGAFSIASNPGSEKSERGFQ